MMPIRRPRTAPEPLASTRTDTWITQPVPGAQKPLYGRCRRCEWPMTLTDGQWRHNFTLQALVCGLSWAGEVMSERSKV